MKLRIEPLVRTAHRIGPAQLGALLQAGQAGTQLALVVEPQRRSNWCWAAVTCALAAHYGDTSWRQHSLAWRILCPAQVTPNGDPPSALLDEERYNQQAPLERTLRYVNCLAAWSNGRPPFRRLMRELDAGRPLALAIRWQTGAQHYVVVDGYCRQRRTLYGADPQGGRFEAGYDDFPRHYRHGGEWMETYWTEQPARAAHKGDPRHEQL